MQVILKHYSNLNTEKYEEHISYNFDISEVSRALLQELARHRISSFSVKSSRYTLGELKKEEPLFRKIPNTNSKDEPYTYDYYDMKTASKYLVITGVDSVDEMSIKALENLRVIIASGISNDKAKYCLPESYKTELSWTINARSLQNFLSLRTSKSALWEIRDLANAIFDALPEDHKYLFEDSLAENH